MLVSLLTPFAVQRLDMLAELLLIAGQDIAADAIYARIEQDAADREASEWGTAFAG